MTVGYAEDLIVGTSYDLGEYQVTHAEIVGFASQWDPQPFHIDDDAAAASQFGAVIASGVHTLGVFQRLTVLAVFRDWQVLAGRSIRNLEFLSPVRPQMTLRGVLRIDEVELSRPDRALVRSHGRITHADKPILTLDIDVYVYRRPSGPT